jgi:hypothetical protein
MFRFLKILFGRGIDMPPDQLQAYLLAEYTHLSSSKIRSV